MVEEPPATSASQGPPPGEDDAAEGVVQEQAEEEAGEGPSEGAAAAAEVETVSEAVSEAEGPEARADAEAATSEVEVGGGAGATSHAEAATDGADAPVEEEEEAPHVAAALGAAGPPEGAPPAPPPEVAAREPVEHFPPPEDNPAHLALETELYGEIDDVLAATDGLLGRDADDARPEEKENGQPPFGGPPGSKSTSPLQESTVHNEGGEEAAAEEDKAAPAQYSAVYGALEEIFSSHCTAHLETQATRPKDPAVVFREQYEALKEYLDRAPQRPDGDASELVFRVPSSSHEEVYNLISSSLQGVRGWQEDRAGGAAAAGGYHWNLLWTWSSKIPIPRSELNVWQRVNHYPKAGNLTRKDALKRHLARARAVTGKNLFNCMPVTFSLPTEYVQFCDAFSKERDAMEDISQNIWIMKPVGMSRGRGIFLINDIQHVSFGDNFVIQKYVRDPLLIDGYKFDLRLYVLVTSFNPLEAFVYRDGFARFSTAEYSSSEESISNKFIHLTNSSIQKQRADAALPKHLRTDGEGGGARLHGDTKCALEHVFDVLEGQGVDTAALWDRIVDTVLASLFAVEDNIPHQVNSFELFGFDVLIDAHLKPWLIEVNSSPSLGTQTALDKAVKTALIQDTVQLVDPLRYSRRELLLALQEKAVPASRRGSRAGVKSLFQGTRAADVEALNASLQKVLRGALPRPHGEPPAHLGRYEMIAPSKRFDKFAKLRRELPQRPGSRAANSRPPSRVASRPSSRR